MQSWNIDIKLFNLAQKWNNVQLFYRAQFCSMCCTCWRVNWNQQTGDQVNAVMHTDSEEIVNWDKNTCGGNNASDTVKITSKLWN